MEATQGTLLGGRVRYAQPRDGYRTGIEPVLLAASVPALAGELVIEAGTGAGAGLMCLAARVPGVRGIGVEIDPAMAELARANVADNGLAGLTILTGDVTAVALPPASHVMANPPWHDPRSTASPLARRRLAKQESAGIEAWVAALARALTAGRSLTMIVPPALAIRATAVCAAAGLGGGVDMSLAPKAGRLPKLTVVQRWAGTSGTAQERQIVLHDEGGAYLPAIDGVLRGGDRLGLD
ncbi:MAG: methyltransferase domain-containing protein [Sphingomonas sp.]|nr:MAG: methyltransferase domain-containing protein [Sphingomonas sp.]